MGLEIVSTIRSHCPIHLQVVRLGVQHFISAESLRIRRTWPQTATSPPAPLLPLGWQLDGKVAQPATPNTQSVVPGPTLKSFSDV